MILKHIFILLTFYSSVTLSHYVEETTGETPVNSGILSRSERQAIKNKRRLTINRCCAKRACKKDVFAPAEFEESEGYTRGIFVPLYDSSKSKTSKPGKGSKKKKKTTTEEIETTIKNTVTSVVAITTSAPIAAPPVVTAAPAVPAAPPPAVVTTVATTTIATTTTTTVATTTICSHRCPCPKPYSKKWNYRFEGLDVFHKMKMSSEKYFQADSSQIFFNGSACGNFFLFNLEPLSFEDAHARCCLYSMKLLTVTSETLKCYLDTVAHNNETKALHEHYINVWTSGTNKGCPNNETLPLKWCGENSSNIDAAYWNSGFPNKTNNLCIKYDYFNLVNLMNVTVKTIPKSGLSTVNCDETYQYICERPSITPTEPTTTTTESCYDMTTICSNEYPKPEYVFTYNRSIERSAAAEAGMTLNACGSEYLIAYNLMKSHIDASKTCCHYYMVPWTINSLDEMKCFANEYAKNFRSPIGPFMLWTGGKLMNDTTGVNTSTISNLRWCGDQRSVNTTWIDIKQDNISSKCLAYNISLNHFKTYKFDKLQLYAEDCNKNYGIVCQKSTTTAPPPCYKTNLCPPKKPCVRDISYESYEEMCCNLGLQVLTVDTMMKKECLGNVLQSQSINYIWDTARSALGCEGNWQYCATGNMVKNNETIWADTLPEEHGNRCLMYYTLPNWKLTSCDDTNKGICEGPVTTTTMGPYSGSSGGLSDLLGGGSSNNNLPPGFPLMLG